MTTAREAGAETLAAAATIAKAVAREAGAEDMVVMVVVVVVKVKVGNE